ncbi:MAG: hypothetical protein WB681_00740 [Candidatus Cybelea sp.]
MINQTVVSRESLHALATLALVTIGTDPSKSNAKPEYNLDGGADEAFMTAIRKKYALPYGASVDFFRGQASGLELGLDIAATIQSNGLDAKATAKAVESAIAAAARRSPEEYTPKEAA